ncbi:MAG: cytochrome c [Pseudomonadota bacterium]|nr:MAG: cytochrome c [Pseudomonadota bacterium]
MMRSTLTGLVLLTGAAMTACTQPAPSPPPASITASVANAPASPNRGHNFSTVTRGAKLFQENCAACHGAQAEGAPNWQKPGADGKYPAPPLNGTAHAWHHPHSVLVRTIKDGTAKLGGSMPAWRDKLGDADIDAIIAWFQSMWPDELYANWKRMDDESRGKARGS